MEANWGFYPLIQRLDNGDYPPDYAVFKEFSAQLRAANHSLATSNWKQYNAVFECLKKITCETGVVFSLPMSALMVQTFIAFFLSKGLRADTVRTYLSAVRAAHTTRGLETPGLSEIAIGAALRGAKNWESLEDEDMREILHLAVRHKF